MIIYSYLSNKLCNFTKNFMNISLPGDKEYEARPSIENKILRINLNENIYGTFVEIGAGQEVVRGFYRVGGASGTIAKSMSAYDRSFSDSIYGKDGEKRYILSPLDISVGTNIVSGDKVPLKIGNALLLSNIPTGLFVHNVELIPGKGGQMVRTAGAYAQVMAHDNGYTTLKLPSGEVRMVSDQCMATTVSYTHLTLPTIITV